MKSRRNHQPDLPADIDCSVNLTEFTAGFNNLVLELAFSDNVYWIARIPHQTVDENYRVSVLSEIATMKTIKQYTTIPVPQVFEFGMSTNPFGYPYMFIECLGGSSVANGLAKSIPQHYHAQVAKQLANVFSELQNITFSRIGRIWRGENADDQALTIIPMDWHSTPGPLETSFEYFYYERQGENREISAIHPGDPDWSTAGWVLKSALSHVIIEDRLRGPFPLCHLDFHFGNMLFDSEYNLTGIIDWANAQAAPLEQLSVCPDFGTFPGLSDEENQPIVELKRLVVESLREFEEERKPGPPLDAPECPGVDTTGSKKLTPLSAYMASKNAEITHRQYMSSPRSLFAGRMVAKLIYGEAVTWEQLRDIYGNMPLQ